MTEPWLSLSVVTIAALWLAGLFPLLARANLVKILLGLELLGKAASFTFILAGYVLNDLGRAQAVVFTIIVIEVMVAALALGLMVLVYRKTGSLQVTDLRRLRG